jgi:hypothetical protein
MYSRFCAALRGGSNASRQCFALHEAGRLNSARLRRAVALAGAAATAAIVGATSGCLGNTSIAAPPPADTVCARGALKAGDSIVNIFDAANGCRIVDLFSAETTFANAYTLALTSGSGYLITMGTTDSNPYLRSSLELVNTKKQLLAYDSYYFPQQAALTFVADSTVNWTVRAATLDTLAGDLGQYFIKMQSCKVPAIVATPADSVTHSDVLTSADCLMPLSDFSVADSSRVQLYSMIMSSGVTRTVSWTSSAPLNVLIGPTYDTFASLRGSFGESTTSGTSGSIDFTPGPTGNYTIVVGTASYSTAPVSYTVTIGHNHLLSTQQVSTQSSRSRSRPPVGQRQSTPLSVMRRGR